RSEERRDGFVARRAALVVRDALGISGVVVGGRKVDAPDRMLDVELVLELERDLLRIADEQQVVRQCLGLRDAGGDAVAPQELALRLAGAVRRLPVARRPHPSGLLAPQLEERG